MSLITIASHDCCADMARCEIVRTNPERETFLSGMEQALRESSTKVLEFEKLTV